MPGIELFKFQRIIAIWDSLTRAVIRFFEQRFIRDDQVSYLRMEIEKLKSERDGYLDRLLNPVQAVTARIDEDEVDWQLLSSTGYQPWSSKQKQLEESSRQRALNIAREAKVKIQQAKTTAELESELLTGTD